MSLGSRMRDARLRQDLTLEQVGEKAGVSRATIQRYEKGVISNIPSDRIEAIARALDVTPSYLMGWDDTGYGDEQEDLRIKYQNTIPVLGRIAAGTPILAEENYDERISLGDLRADFALRVSGDSMTGSDIFEGDIAFIKKTETLENREIGAILIDDEATLKRFTRIGDQILLEATNPTTKGWPRVYKDYQLDDIKILGRLVGVYHPVD